MTESNNHGWVWSALEGLVDLTTKHDEAVSEAERLEGLIRGERERIHESTGLSQERLVEMVEGMRVIGAPPSAATAAAPEAPAAAGATDAPDPLAIPTYLRRGEESRQEDPPKTGTQVETART